jgi:sialate O-acetylesterase
VVVQGDAVMEPKFVRYGWANSPICNLFDGDGLPASPFTSAE